MLRECVLLCSLWGFTVGMPQAATLDSFQAVPALLPQQLTPVDTIVNRDFKESGNVAGDAGITGYTGGATGGATGGGVSLGGYSGGGTDVGQYYYYYPVQEEKTADASAGAGAGDHVLSQPLKIIQILLVAILLQLALPDILATIARFLPTVVVEPLNIPWPDPNGRDLTDTQILSLEKLNKLTTSVRSAIESDECLPRLVCYTARYAQGSKSLLRLLEYIPSEEYSFYVKIVKDSALRKADCNIYKCGTLGTKD